MTTAIPTEPVSQHEEKIICPECKSIETATVLHTFPWATFIHECSKCKYVIMESEWEKLKQKS